MLESCLQAQSTAAGEAEAADLGSCSQTNPFKSANKLIQISFMPTKCINNTAMAMGPGRAGALSPSEANMDYML